jgi:hypothetical protein
MATAAQYAEGADVVVLGAVEEILADSGAGRRDREGVVRLRVDRVLKGDVPPFVEVVNGNCNGAALSARQKGAFFLQREDGELTAHLCGGSGFITPKEAMAALGRGDEPNRSNPPPAESVVIDRDEPAQSVVPVVFVLGGGLVLVLTAVGTTIAVRNRRS